MMAVPSIRCKFPHRTWIDRSSRGVSGTGPTPGSRAHQQHRIHQKRREKPSGNEKKDREEQAETALDVTAKNGSCRADTVPEVIEKEFGSAEARKSSFLTRQ